MAKWSSEHILLTKKGEELLSKVQAGVGSITVTRIVTGGSYTAVGSLKDLEAVADIKQEATILSTNTSSEGSIIKIEVSNETLEAEYDLYQIGIYVTHSEAPEQEILYTIAQCDISNPDHIPLASVTPIDLAYNLYMVHSGTSDVTISVTPAGTVSREEFDSLTNLFSTHESNKDIHVTKEEKASYADKYTKQEIDEKLEGFNPDLSNYYNKSEVDGKFSDVDTKLSKKVDKEDGKGLSTNDFTNEYKEKLDKAGTGTGNTLTLRLRSQTITGGTWEPDSSYSDYPYKADITAEGVTEADWKCVDMFTSSDDALYMSDTVDVLEGIVRFYASKNIMNDIVFDSIDINKVVNAEDA